MSDNLKDILSNLNPDIDQETLLLYLQGKLSVEKQHELEQKMQDSSFESEALDGLHHFQNKEQLALLVDQLNRDLKTRIKKRRKPLRKMDISQQQWLWYALVIFLLLIILSYIIIHRYNH